MSKIKTFKCACMTLGLVALNSVVSFADPVSNVYPVDALGNYQIVLFSKTAVDPSTVVIMSPTNKPIVLSSCKLTYDSVAADNANEFRSHIDTSNSDSSFYQTYEFNVGELGDWVISYDNSNDTVVDLAPMNIVESEVAEAKQSDYQCNILIDSEDDNYKVPFSIVAFKDGITYNYNVSVNDVIVNSGSGVGNQEVSNIIDLSSYDNGTYSIKIEVNTSDNQVFKDAVDIAHFDPSKVQVEETEYQYSDEELALINQFPSAYDNIEIDETESNTDEISESKELATGDKVDIIGSEGAVEINTKTEFTETKEFKYIIVGIVAVLLSLIAFVIYRINKKNKENRENKKREQDRLRREHNKNVTKQDKVSEGAEELVVEPEIRQDKTTEKQDIAEAKQDIAEAKQDITEAEQDIGTEKQDFEINVQDKTEAEQDIESEKQDTETNTQDIENEFKFDSLDEAISGIDEQDNQEDKLASVSDVNVDVSNVIDLTGVETTRKEAEQPSEETKSSDEEIEQPSEEIESSDEEIESVKDSIESSASLIEQPSKEEKSNNSLIENSNKTELDLNDDEFDL